jgi:hypothetical protein
MILAARLDNPRRAVNPEAPREAIRLVNSGSHRLRFGAARARALQPNEAEDTMPNSKSKAGRDQAIHYNENVAEYASSSKAKEAAERAKRAIQDPRQAKALRKAEKAGKRRARTA